ncbi:MAG: hypothetical protein ABI972_06005 [Acidobacteriota bacterium]
MAYGLTRVNPATIPVVALAGYVTAALLVNQRRTEITSEGVTAAISPLPVCGTYRIPRDSIRLCHARKILEETEQASGVFAEYLMAGVETREGWQLDLAGPFSTEGEALACAREMARVLSVEAAFVPVTTVGPSHKTLAIVWTVLVLAAIAGSALWHFGGD